jgi:hypothetical protein
VGEILRTYRNERAGSILSHGILNNEYKAFQGIIFQVQDRCEIIPGDSI